MYYTVVYNQLWDGHTARTCRGDATLMAVYFYLMTTPHANMIGVFTLPTAYICHHTGLPAAQIEQALTHFEQEGFIVRDRDCDWIFVKRMAEIRLQLGTRKEPLHAKDNRLSKAHYLYRLIPSSTLAEAFYMVYHEPLKLPPRQGQAAEVMH